MKRKLKPEPVPKTHRVFPVGSRVLICRPSLWSGCEAIVEKVSPEGIHLVLIGNLLFHSKVTGSELVEITAAPAAPPAAPALDNTQ